MKEATRQFYLSALGIDVWEARYPLPGAAASAPQVMEETGSVGETEPKMDPPVPPDVPAHRGTASHDLDQIKSVLDSDTTPGEDEGDDDIATLPALDNAGTVESTISIQACIWHGQKLSLAADLGTDSGGETQLRLGANIVKALGEPAAAPEFIHWPAFQNRALPGNDDSAFNRLVSQMIEADPSHSWLLLGPETLEILSPRLRSQAHKVRLSCEVTLSQLVSDGASKRSLWESIQRSQREAQSGNGNG